MTLDVYADLFDDDLDVVADAMDAADQMVLAKWVLREVAHSYGIEVSFSPKIAVGQAGSGMHFHTRLVKDGVNQFSTGSGLTEDALAKAFALGTSPSVASAWVDGQMVRPDMVIRLSRGRNIVVDAKVPFTGYIEAVQAEDVAVRAERVAAHARQRLALDHQGMVARHGQRLVDAGEHARALRRIGKRLHHREQRHHKDAGERADQYDIGYQCPVRCIPHELHDSDIMTAQRCPRAAHQVEQEQAHAERTP